MSTSLFPMHIQRHIRQSTAAGHRLVSQGCGLFRCTKCDSRQFIDTQPMMRPCWEIREEQDGKQAKGVSK